jgi:membrane fusion protein, heavy metal efflux system
MSKIAIGVALVTVLAVGWLLHEPRTGGAREAPLASTAGGDGDGLASGALKSRYIELAVATEAPALSPAPAPGRVAFDEAHTASVGVPLPGQIDEVAVRLGDSVKAGDRLFSVRSGALADLARELETARSEATVKRRLAGRARELASLKAIAEKDYLAAAAESREAELALKAAESKRESLQVQIDGENRFWVTAPRDGTIVEHDVFASQEVTPERAASLVRISDLGEVLVLADIQERDAYDVAVGTPVAIQASGTDVTQRGTIENISELVDLERRTVVARIRAENAAGLLHPNALVQVRLEPDSSAKRVRVPAEAVVKDGQRSVVFVADDHDGIRSVRVLPGRERDGQLELRAGLEPGTRYVAKGALLLLNQVGVSL